MRSRGRQRRGIDAFAGCVVNGQVAVSVKLHRPDGVEVVVRPLERRWWDGGVIAREQRIYGCWNMIVFPPYQQALIRKCTAGKEKIAGLSGRRGRVLGQQLEAGCEIVDRKSVV